MAVAETIEQALKRIDAQLVKAETLWSDYVALASKMQSRAMEPEYGADKFKPLIDRLTAEKATLLERAQLED